MTDCPPANDSGEGTGARPTVASIFARHGEAYLAAHPSLSPKQRRLIHDVRVCRTADLGGHVYVCDDCGHRVPVYNSCRNRGCPTCQALEQARWIEARKKRLLPVGHHHVVATLPAQLRPLAQQNPRAMFRLLFDAVRDMLTVLPRDHLGLQLGVTAVLHTWTRSLLFHPHVHCIVTAGGLTLDGVTPDDDQWVHRAGFLLPIALMKAYFRGRILHYLARGRRRGELLLPGEVEPTDQPAWDRLVRSLPKPDKWCIHIQKPFGRSAHIVEYLGRYTHRIAISDSRLVSVDDGLVRFRGRDDDLVALSPFAFLGRFLLHVLPAGLHKIRHFGLYAAAHVRGRLATARALLGEGDGGLQEEPPDEAAPETAVELLLRLTGEDLLVCPACRTGRMQRRPLPEPTGRSPPWAA